MGTFSWLAVAMAATPAAALCPGDCNGDGVVSINELVRSVNVALGSSALPVCPPADRDGSGTIDIDELTSAVLVSLEGCPATVQVYRSPEAVAPSRTEGVLRGVLPNGRIVEPAGRQVPLETLPLNLALVPGERYLIVSNDGYRDEDGEQYVQVVDTSTLALTKTQTGTGEFLGLGLTPAGTRAFVSQDTDDGPVVLSLHLAGNTAVVDPQPLAQLPNGSFPTGMTLSPDGHHLYVLGMVSNALYSVDLDSGTVHEAAAKVGNYPSAVADNDAGMGMIVDALSHSPFWPHMAIFVTEDDPQGGEDHVATHRTVDYLISPYVKHGYVSHVHHSSMSMTKTMELLLDVKPMSEYDRYATDMRDYFTSTPDLTPYTALPRTFPPEVNPSASSARNSYLRKAAEMSEGIDWGQVDQAGWKLAEILRLIHIGEAAPNDAPPWSAGWKVAGVIVALGLTSLAWRRRLLFRFGPAAPNLEN